MLSLALALSLAAAGGPGDLDLPRTLGADESTYFAPAPAAAHEDLAFFAGLHLGVGGAYDADHPCFIIGANGRAHILPWLGADVSIDFQTKQKVDNSASIFQVPFMFTGLFYPPLGDLPIRPYGQFGIGFSITDVTVPGPGADTSDAELLFHLGFGVEFELSPNFLLDANVRFVFIQDPPRSGNFSADWAQFTVGIMIKLSK